MDVSHEAWYFIAPCLNLMNKDAPQRRYPLREMYNAPRWIVRSGASWRLLLNEFPPCELVDQRTQRWIQAGCFEATANNLRSITRIAQQRRGEARAVIPDGRTLQSNREGGLRAGYDQLAGDYQRLPEILTSLQSIVFSVLTFVHFAALNKSP
ncbi:transposase [Paraburkholderia sp. RAU6.4a]